MRAVYLQNDLVINCAKWSDGATLPSGWVESEESQKGWSYTDGVFSAPPVPTLTFDEELEDLDNFYESEALKLSNEYMIAMARDGANETAKVTAVREKITALDLTYEQDVLVLISKYSEV